MTFEIWHILLLLMMAGAVGFFFGYRRGALYVAERAAGEFTALLAALAGRLAGLGMNGREEIDKAMVEAYGQEYLDHLAKMQREG